MDFDADEAWNRFVLISMDFDAGEARDRFVL
jgi:hypothetical protein